MHTVRGIKLKKILYMCSSSIIVLVIFIFSSKALAASAPQIAIDQPLNGTYVQSALSFTGWAANDSGISYVCVRYDNENVWRIATTDSSRPTPAGFDSGSTVGFSYSSDVTSFSLGVHTISVAAVGKDGKTTTTTFQVTKAAAVTHLENPSGNTYLQSQDIPVYGWAISATGIYYDCMSIDGKPWQMVTFGQPSPGLNAAYHGAYKNADSTRFTYTIPKGTLSPGKHTIYLGAVGNDMSVDIATTTVNVAAVDPIVTVDQQMNNSYIQNTLSFTGWATNMSGISYICVRYDNESSWRIAPKDPARYPAVGHDRSDFSGYNYSGDVTGLSDGTHTIYVAAVGNDGQIKQTFFKVVKASPVICFDGPSGSVYSSYDLTLNGWGLNASGISYNCVSINGSTWQLMTAGEPSQGLNAAYHGAYKDADTSRFSYKVPKTMLREGTNSITVASVGIDRTIAQTSRLITIGSPSPAMGLVGSLNNSYITDKLSFNGIAVNSSGIQYVCLDIDSDLKWRLGATSTNITNLASYPDGSTAGFNFNTDVTNLSVGTHAVRVAAVGNNNQITYAYFNVVKAAPSMAIVSPGNGSLISASNSTVVGYALNASGINYDCVSIDGSAWQAMNSNVQIGGLDQYQYEYKNPSGSGFTYTIPSLSIGKHTITVAANGNDGMQTFQTFQVTVVGTITNVNYSTTMSNLFNYQISADADASMQINGSWEYLHDYSPGGSIYNTIYNTLAYYITPDNLVNDNTDIFDFMDLRYVGGVSASGLNHFLGGVLAGKGQEFIDAGARFNVNPVYLAMHAYEETGNGSSKLSKGQNPSGQNIGYFNEFGIYAYDNDPVNNGNLYAEQQGWTSVDLAIDGGAQWISTYYVNSSARQQYTLYDMRFSPYDPTCGHCYSTDILWAHNIASLIRQYYNSYGSNMLTFYVPHYS